MGIHFVLRIPHGLELTEGVHQLRAKHLREQGATRLPVAVFTGERTSIAHNQVGCSLDKVAILTDAGFALQIKADPHVDTSVPEVAVERSFIAVLVHERADIPQIGAQLLRRYRRIIPAFPLRRGSWCKGRCPWPG